MPMGHALAYVYFEDEPGRRSVAILMTRDEARRTSPSYRTCSARRELLGAVRIDGSGRASSPFPPSTQSFPVRESPAHAARGFSL